MTFAIPQESRGFRRAVRGSAQAGALIVSHTGIGADAARSSLERLISKHRPERIVSAGFAGALDPGLAVGDIAIGENFSDPAWLHGLGISARRGILLTREAPVATAADKARLRAETGALAVDMETAIVADACAKQGIPLLSLRAISDTAAKSLPLPFSVSWDMKNQRPRPLAVALYLARHPRRIGPLRRFIADLACARRALCAALVEAVLSR